MKLSPPYCKLSKMSVEILTTEYSRTSMAQTLMARLPRLLESLGKKPIAADIIIYGMIKYDFLCYVENSMLCVLIRIASMRRF